MAHRDPAGTGITEPEIVRGLDPTTMPVWRPKRKPSPWFRHFELGRQNPAVWNPATQDYDGGWILASEAKKGGCKERQRIINSDRMRIVKYLERYHSVERWQLKQITLANTHCDRELYIRYLGEVSVEEDEAQRWERRQAWQARQDKIKANRARKAQEARDKAREEQAAAQLRIRGRKSPGG